jgi:hypothetical protein
MKDFNILTEALDQRANGTIEVLDFSLINGIASQGEYEILDYALLIGAKASQTIEVLDYSLIQAGDRLYVNGVPLVEGTDFDAETDDETTAANLAAAIALQPNVTAAAVGAVITVEAEATGEAGNAYTLSWNANPSAVSIGGATLEGGIDEGSVTVDATELVQGTDFDAETDNATTAANLATAIAAISGVGASADGAVITVTADTVGEAGNSIATTADVEAGALTVSGATLEGGQDAGTITVGSDTITEGVDFDAETDNETTAENIATAIDALSGVGATADGAIVTVTNDASGTAGNSKALEATPVEAFTLSGATLAGGVAATYSEVLDFSGVEELKNVEVVGFLESISGSSTPTVTVTPQYSIDKVNWFDHTTSFATGFTVVNTPQKLDLDFTALYMRFKLVNSGTNTVANMRLQGVAK